MPTTHTHYVPRPPVDEQPLTPNTLRAAASTLIFGRRPSATRLSTAAQLPENTVQSILEFLDDDALARAMTACRAWHDVACGSAWADKAWRARGDDAVRAFEQRGGADAACAAAVRKEGGRRHCCARGRFLAMAFTPACQLRRRARRRRREADAAARRWAEERRQAERELQRATRRLRIVALIALLALRATLGAGEAARVLLWPSRVVWRVAASLFVVVDPLRVDASTMPFMHAILAPEALEVRRHAFFAAVVLCVAHCAALVAWWRFLWYALGAFCSDHLGLASLDAARCRVALLRLEESSEARFAWLRAVAAERRESLGLLTAPDITVGDDVTLHATSLHIAAAFHAGPDDALPQNPHRGLDDDDDALPAILHEVLGTEKKRGRRSRFRSLLGDVFRLHRAPLLVLAVAASVLASAALIILWRRESAIFDGACRVGSAVAVSLRDDLLLLASVPARVAYGSARLVFGYAVAWVA